jgi:hypothetical protein
MKGFGLAGAMDHRVHPGHGLYEKGDIIQGPEVNGHHRKVTENEAPVARALKKEGDLVVTSAQ